MNNVCFVEWCSNPVRSNLLCKVHLNQKAYDERKGFVWEPRQTVLQFTPPTYEECDNGDGTASIPLYSRQGASMKPSGEYVLVDIEDLPLLLPYRWISVRAKRSISDYAVARMGNSTVHMHRLLLGSPKGMVVGHINNDGLDNRRENLRVLTKRENAQNLPNTPGRGNKFHSEHRGVSYRKDLFDKPWVARVGNKHIGFFRTEEEAHKAARKSRAELMPYSAN